MVRITPVVVQEKLSYRHLVSGELWDRLVNRIVEDDGLDQNLAERVMNEALGFMLACAEHPGNGLSPSPLVDIGWHTFIQYTRGYAKFCEKYAGRFIHHEPSDRPGQGPAQGGVKQTHDFMLAHGYTLDESLWTKGSADCTEGWGDRCEAQCDDGPRCSEE